MTRVVGSGLDDVVRAYVGTPWRHRGRVPGVGLDCVGELACGGAELGIDVSDLMAYSRTPSPRTLLGALGARATRVSLPDGPKLALEADPAARALLRPGRVVVFWVVRPTLPRHVGVASALGMIHATLELGKVVEQRLPGSGWEDRVHSVWELDRG